MVQQTGRTTRMFAYAAELSRKRHAVYVVMASRSEFDGWKEHLKQNHPDEAQHIKFETPGTLTNYDLLTGRFHGAHPNCRVLVDHHVYERLLEFALQQLHRFDKPKDGFAKSLEAVFADKGTRTCDIGTCEASAGGCGNEFIFLSGHPDLLPKFCPYCGIGFNKYTREE